PRTRSESARGLAHSKTSRRARWFMERGSPPEMGIGAVGSDVHVPKLTPLDVSVEEEQVAAAGLIPLEMGRVVLFRPASLNAGVTVAGAVDLVAIPRERPIRGDDPFAGARVDQGPVGHAPGNWIKRLGDVGATDSTGALESDGVTDHAITWSVLGGDLIGLAGGKRPQLIVVLFPKRGTIENIACAAVLNERV